MHVFCDESGGAAPGNPHFTLAVAAMDQHAAARVVKRFRKVAKLKGGEIKGSSLNATHRELFMQVLADEGCRAGAAVVCARGDPVAGWAFRTYQRREPVLYRHLLAEALGVLGIGAEVQGITADGGRYTRAELDLVATNLTADIERLAGRRVPFGYGDSAKSPGLQIADVLCNTAGKLLTDGPQQGVAAKALAPLIERKLVVVKPARLPGCAPPHLGPQLLVVVT